MFVNSNGEAVALKTGTAKVYAVAKDGSRTTGYSKITVNETGKSDSKRSIDNNASNNKTGKVVKATSIKVSPSSVSVGRNQTTTLKVSFAPGNVTNKNVTWKSSNTKVATVDKNGKVKGKSKGTTTITATTKDGSKKSAKATIKVVNKILVTDISMDKKISLKAGKTKTLKVLYVPTNASTKKVTWTSSNRSVAVVSSKGVVKGKSKGTAIITATAKDGSKKSAKCTVKVTGNSKTSDIDSEEYKKNHKDIEIIQKRIFIGDSRTEGMRNAVGLKSYDVWSAKTGEGYDWMVKTGVPNIENEIGEATAVIFLMGINDYGNNARAEAYSNYINKKASIWLKKGAKVYFVSVNAVDDSKSQIAKNDSIKAFNVKVKSLLSKNVTYIDTYNNINWNTVKFDSTGVHYDNETYTIIYKYILSKLYNKKTTTPETTKTKNIKVTKVTVSGTNKVQVGKSITLKATITPSNASNKSVTWKSNNTKVATVSTSGKVKGIKAGTVTITATAKDGSKKKGTYKVTVSKKSKTTTKTKQSENDKNETIKILSFNEKKLANKVGVGEYMYYGVFKYDSSTKKYTKLSTNSYTITSSNENVVSITNPWKNDKQHLSFKNVGTATITVSLVNNNQNDKVTINVTNNPTFKIQNNNRKLDDDKCYTKPLSLEIKDNTNTDIYNVEYETNSTYPDTLSLSKRNLKIKNNIAKIKVFNSHKYIKFEAINVKGVIYFFGDKKEYKTNLKDDCTTKVDKVVISGENNVEVGKSITLKATITPSNASNKSVNWKSNNTKVATVSSNGKVKGIKKGTVTITATTKDGSKKNAKFTIKVIKENSKDKNLNRGNVTKKSSNTYIHFINVGSSDATLIESNGKYGLIDASNPGSSSSINPKWNDGTNNGTRVLNYLKKIGVTRLDFVLASHDHSDHIGGIPELVYNSSLVDSNTVYIYI